MPVPPARPVTVPEGMLHCCSCCGRPYIPDQDEFVAKLLAEIGRLRILAGLDKPGGKA